MKEPKHQDHRSGNLGRLAVVVGAGLLDELRVASAMLPREAVGGELVCPGRRGRGVAAVNEKQRTALVMTIAGAALPIAVSMLSTYRVVDTFCNTAAFIIIAFGIAGFI